MNITKESTKLYSGLNAHQAASLAFSAAVDHRYAEMKDIVDSQPLVHIISVPLPYASRAMGLYHLSLYFGVIYWKSYAAMMQLAYEDNLKRYNEQCELLGSIEAALAQVCESMSVSAQSIKKLAMAPTDNNFIALARPTLTAEYVEIFTNLGK